MAIAPFWLSAVNITLKQTRMHGGGALGVGHNYTRIPLHSVWEIQLNLLRKKKSVGAPPPPPPLTSAQTFSRAGAAS